jgi:hypothetical protein
MSPRLRPPPFTEAQKTAWNNIHSFASNNGCAITSPPFTSPIMLTCAPNSSVPHQLDDAGYVVKRLGTEERLMPVTETITKNRGGRVERQHVEPQLVTTWEIHLTGFN